VVSGWVLVACQEPGYVERPGGSQAGFLALADLVRDDGAGGEYSDFID
jgi:hypothetical protein